MAYAIEKGIPLPTKERQSSGESKYNWHEMEVGDSIWIGDEEIPEGKDLAFLRNRVYQAARKYAAAHGKKFIAEGRTEKRPNPDFSVPVAEGKNPPPREIEVQGVRVWRMPDPEKKAAPAVAEQTPPADAVEE